MTRVLLSTILGLSVATLAFGCSVQTEPASELTAEQSAALEAAIEHLDDTGALQLVPIADSELHALGEKFVLQALAATSCEHKGIVAGLWYDEDYQAVFDGAWFELGTSQLAGAVYGGYGQQRFAGTVLGPQIGGSVAGVYAQGDFDGRWKASVGPGGLVHHGELQGVYERRNAMGGYFFGVWADCGAGDPDGTVACSSTGVLTCTSDDPACDADGTVACDPDGTTSMCNPDGTIPCDADANTASTDCPAGTDCSSGTSDDPGTGTSQ